MDVFSALSDLINLIPFHERPASQDTRLEYQQQGNWNNLKIHFGGLSGLEGVKENLCWIKQYVFGVLEL